MRSSIVVARQRGFNLIEIMVVVVIIGLLASIVAPMVSDKADKARVQKAKADMEAIKTALKLYQLDNFNYPSSEQGLVALVTKPSSAPIPRNYSTNGYIEQLQLDPWGRDYLYVSPGEGHPYDIYTLGADGTSGGDEQNADISVWEQAAKAQ
jgi:general secretion pathway protein G